PVATRRASDLSASREGEFACSPPCGAGRGWGNPPRLNVAASAPFVKPTAREWNSRATRDSVAIPQSPCGTPIPVGTAPLTGAEFTYGGRASGGRLAANAAF